MMARKEWESRLRLLELIIEGAVREFTEETGIRVDEIDVLCSDSDSHLIDITVDL